MNKFGGNILYISADFEKSLLFEHRFWLQVLGDHSRFILNTLSPKAKDNIERATYFKNTFDSLLNRARGPVSGRELDELNQVIVNEVQRLRAFKLQLIKEHIAGKIDINLPPTFINHMVNELDEYLKILNCFMNNSVPEAHPLHHHLLWLLDGYGHASAIYSNLDDVEADLKKKSHEFAKNFGDLHMKAMEFAGYLRTGVNKFPALSRLNKQAELKMLMFMEFLKELEGMRLSKEALGIIMPLMLDHMYREECYYLTKLSQVAEVKRPGCDPGKPRVNE